MKTTEALNNAIAEREAHMEWNENTKKRTDPDGEQYTEEYARERIDNRAKETLNEQNEWIARQIAMQEREDTHEWRDEAPGWQEWYREAEDGTRYSIKAAMSKVETRAREIAQNFN